MDRTQQNGHHNMFKTFICGLGVLLLVLSGCQRKQDSETTQIGLVLPATLNKAGSQAITSTMGLSHVVINVTASDMSPIYYSWDKKGDFGVINTVPSSFPLDISQGSGRLIQVIAVYEDSVTKDMSFYYGDTSQSISGDSMTISLPVSAMGASSGAEGEIHGRYMTSTTAGPTGKLQIRLRPPNNRPSMVIQETRILNGWFNTFALDGQNFEYVVDGTTTLFGGPMSLNSFKALASTSILATNIPDHYYYDSGNSSYTFEKGRVDIRGFFGSGATGKKVCYYQSTMAAVSYMYQDNAGTAAIQYDPTTYTVSKVSRIAGGVSDTANCTGTYMSDYMTLDPYYSPNNWNNRIKPPFRTDWYMTGTAPSFVVNSLYLIPDFDSVVTGLKVYELSEDAKDQVSKADHEMVDCDEVAKGEANYPLKVKLLTTITTWASAQSVPFNQTSVTAAIRPRLVVCPISSGATLPGLSLN